MIIKELLQEITKPLHEDAYKTAEHFTQQWQKVSNKLIDVNTDLQSANTKVVSLNKELSDLKSKQTDNLPKSTDSVIDQYLSSRFKRIENISYTGKRTSAIPQLKKTVSGAYNIFLNEFITPNAWEVINFKRDITGVDDIAWFQNLGLKLKPKYKWINEIGTYESNDEYLYPAEVLTFMIQSADCEDMAFTVVSMRPEITCYNYGFYHNLEENKDFCHAWPSFIFNGDEYVVEFTLDKFQITKLPDPRYDAYFKGTKDFTYEVKKGVSFGIIANWR